MSWNYRVLVEEHGKGEDREEFFAVFEVYYDENGKPDSYTTTPVAIAWSDCDDVNEVIDLYMQAFKKPYLWKTTLNEYEA